MAEATASGLETTPTPASVPAAATPNPAIVLYSTIRDALTQFHAQFPLHTFPSVHTPPTLPSKDQSILYVFPRSPQMPTSQEPESSLLLFSSYPHKVEEHFQHETSPSGELPFLLTPTGKILAGRDIIDEVQDKSGNLSAHLSPEEQSDVLAFTALAETKLRLCLMYALWKEEPNHLNVAYPIYESNFTWPLNLLVPRIKRYEALDWLAKRRTVLNGDEIAEDARSALASFSAKLDSQLFLFGAKPTGADAALFAYLHVILSALNVTGAEAKLRDAVLKHENLVQYTRRIWST
ncbi:hypothetical protein HDU97_007735 [Phlyctochytrium planicorne]|nr:hypothetical protein HDU97_007735 [Phlyctochytrium planicorne]